MVVSQLPYIGLDDDMSHGLWCVYHRSLFEVDDDYADAGKHDGQAIAVFNGQNIGPSTKDNLFVGKKNFFFLQANRTNTILYISQLNNLRPRAVRSVMQNDMHMFRKPNQWSSCLILSQPPLILILNRLIGLCFWSDKANAREVMDVMSIKCAVGKS